LHFWSISTTLRSPDRAAQWTRAFKSFEGQVWDRENQIKYQCELIKTRAYRPTQLKDEYVDLLDNLERVVSEAKAREIFESKNYEDPPLRGRTSMSAIRSLGLIKVQPQMALTKQGQLLAEGSIPLSEILLSFALKWQLPIPSHSSYKLANGFEIRPFVGMLALIDAVNRKWEAAGNSPKGLSLDEFHVFVQTLINYRDIDDYATRIVNLRRKVENALPGKKKTTWEDEIKNHLASLPHGGIATSNKVLSTLRDYGDNTLRYFRPTGFIEYRGNGRYVDIAKVMTVQCQLLISQGYAKPDAFENSEEYFDFLGDGNLALVPWSESGPVNQVKEYLRDLIQSEIPGAQIPDFVDAESRVDIRGEDDEIRALKKIITDSKLAALKVESKTADFVSTLQEEFSILQKRNYPGYLEAPVALEFAAFKSFVAINDALQVKPNYPVADDGEPLSTAPGGGTDLECRYSSFDLSVEVTLSRGISQWMMEGQPVQRHLRSLEQNSDRTVYCLFLAPTLAPDTVNTFWVANVIGYEGSKQRIIPMKIDLWIEILELFKGRIVEETLSSNELQSVLEAGLPTGDEISNSTLWLDRISRIDTYRDLVESST
jgi:hypothetical protein